MKIAAAFAFLNLGLLSFASSTSVWETRPSGEFPALYSYDASGVFDPSQSSKTKPTSWEPKFYSCDIDPLTSRCTDALPYHTNKTTPRLRGLQQNDAYVVVLFGDNANVPQAARDIFEGAAEFWNRAIAANGLFPFQAVFNRLGVRGRIADVNYGLGCGIRSETFTLRNADSTKPAQLVILAQVEPIDGRGGTLARAGPCIRFRDVAGSFQSYSGIMTFDEADFNAQLASDRNGLANTVKHEMGHVLGVGTFWRLNGLVQNPVSENPANLPTYSGSEGIRGSALLGVSAPVRVENNNGPGTADAHWEESVYRNELMTGFLNRGSNPGSIMTMKSLLDLGLVVNECAAEDFFGHVTDPVNCINFFNPNNPNDPNNGNRGDPFASEQPTATPTNQPISPTESTSTASPSAESENNNINNNAPGLRDGEIAGISIGVIIALAAVGFILSRPRPSNNERSIIPKVVDHSPFYDEYGNRRRTNFPTMHHQPQHYHGHNNYQGYGTRY